MRGDVDHAPAAATRADASAVTTERDQKIVAAGIAVSPRKAVSEDPAAQVLPELGFDILRKRCGVGLARVGEERLEVRADERVEDCLGRTAGSIRGRERRHGPLRKRARCPIGLREVSETCRPEPLARANSELARARSGAASRRPRRPVVYIAAVSARKHRPRRSTLPCDVCRPVRTLRSAERYADGSGPSTRRSYIRQSASAGHGRRPTTERYFPCACRARTARGSFRSLKEARKRRRGRADRGSGCRFSALSYPYGVADGQ